jgi:hypothetical protein
MANTQSQVKHLKIKTEEPDQSVSIAHFNMPTQVLNQPGSPNTIAATVSTLAAINGNIAAAIDNITPTSASTAVTTDSISVPTTGTTSPPNTNPTPTTKDAQPFRKLAYHLAPQPALLADLRAYRATQTAQHRDAAKTIATLEKALALANRKATEVARRVAEDKKADEDMIVFWTDSYGDECAENLKLVGEVARLEGENASLRVEMEGKGGQMEGEGEEDRTE